MTFGNLTAGESIFVDANTFVYHFAPDPILGPSCGQLIQRIDSRQVRGFTSTHVLSETAHRLMTIEASTLFGWPFQGISYRLQKHPAQLQKLSAFRQAVETVLNSKMQILTIAPSLVLTAATLSQQTGLLSNDALIVALMQQSGLTNIASNDSDFDRVPGIKRHAPV